MVKRGSLKTPLALSLLLLFLLIIIAALQLEASVPMKTFHYVEEFKNWSDAQQYCKEKFTDLASARSQREDLLNELEKNGGRDAWIGLYRDPGNISVWRWTGESGDVSSDTNWAAGEPEMRNCTYLNYGDHMWYNHKCSRSFMYFCSNKDNNDVGYIEHSMSWLNAQESCKNSSKVLATVTQSNHDKKPLDKEGGWIGLHMSPNTPVSDTAKDIWKWIGKDSDFRKWAPGQPNHDDCGYVYIRTNKWYSSPCSRKRPFLCFVDNLILVKENKTWEEALDHCRAIGSDDPSQHNHYREHQYDLVSLQSDHDHRYARDKIQEATTNEVWTSLRFLAGEWLWVDGEPLPPQYQNLPLCPAWGRRCGTLPKDHATQWETRDCMERRNFLCIKSPAKTEEDD